jgi:hypothetical protein
MPRTQVLYVDPDRDLPRIKEFLLRENGGKVRGYIKEFVSKNRLNYSKFVMMLGGFQPCEEYKELCLKAMKAERE